MCAKRRQGQAAARIAAAADRPAAGQKTQTCPKKKGVAPRSAPPGEIVGKKGAYDFAICVSYKTAYETNGFDGRKGNRQGGR